MVRCVDCSNLEIASKKKYLIGTDRRTGMKELETFYTIIPCGKEPPIGEGTWLRCRMKGYLRYNWNIYKERKCQYFEKRI